jgi:hypothetical protein
MALENEAQASTYKHALSIDEAVQTMNPGMHTTE